jgi:uncharacterized protein with FMN-binding domain
VRKSAIIAVSAISLSAISVSYAKGVTPEATNGLAPLDPAATSSAAPSASSSTAPQPSSSASSSASSAPQPSASKSTGSGSGSTTAPKPKPSATKTTAPKPSASTPPAPVVKTVNSDVINYVTNGLQKNLQIAVTFSGTTITDIQILQGDTNNGIGKAYPVLIKAAIAAQGNNFGNYTGATYTTNAFKNAVANAIGKL